MEWPIVARRVMSTRPKIGRPGVLASSAVDHLYRAVRSLRIYEGTTEIQRLLVARELLGT